MRYKKPVPNNKWMRFGVLKRWTVRNKVMVNAIGGLSEMSLDMMTNEIMWRVTWPQHYNIINKNLRAFKVFLKESFKVGSYNESGTFVMTLILASSNANRATEKWGYKKDIIYYGSAKDFEMVFTLLTKVVTFYMRLTLIDFWGPSF